MTISPPDASAPRRRLPAEWEPQDGLLLTWPHAATDWAPLLATVEPVFVAIAVAAARAGRVVIVCHDVDVRARVARLLSAVAIDAGPSATARVRLCVVPTDDTWARDHGPLTVITEDGGALPLSFRFRGWGGKFPAARDDAINAGLSAQGVLARSALELPLELEGGAIESDGRGTVLTTSTCLLNANRNAGGLRRAEAEAALRDHLGATRVLWLDHGHLEGDDTDSHIDTLARFAPGVDGRGETIVYVACDDPSDAHFADLLAMRRQLEAMRTADGRPYALRPLPWPRPQYDAEGCRLPATYANYTILDDAVLVPTYEDAADAEALRVVAAAHPGRACVAIDCRPLIWQHGSLHCVTMQLPRGALAGEEER